jgi:predicted nucleic acid-binding protein
MIILDASVLIGHLDGRDRHHHQATKLLVANAGTSLGASSISLAETLVAPARSDRIDAARDALERLAVTELPFGSGAPQRLALLRAETGLKLPDCCVLLAAQDHDGVVASFDTNLCRSAQALGLAVA